MRCNCCDRRLSDYESSLKNPATQVYHDTCIKCLKEIGLAYTGNPTLEPQEKGETDGRDNEFLWKDQFFDEE